VREGDDQEAINRMFSPEFRNRLDAVIGFANLTPAVMGQVVDKFIMQLEAQLGDRNVTIELDEAARNWLAEKGHDPQFGARPLARVIQDNVKKPLAEELLFGKLSKGGSAKVTVAGDKLVFDLKEEVPAPVGPAREEEGEDEREPELVGK
ncbi:MAG: ATP-dependent Clp protease ATP-binding subunit ClpA, partial [Alphaproteobacteria bacterium]|nr:ATP-dependent Clp protease ATP-binding subunit ClpA [Alphaproteobacteria bacterium]